MICGGTLILVANVIALPHDCNYPISGELKDSRLSDATHVHVRIWAGDDRLSNSRGSRRYSKLGIGPVISGQNLGNGQMGE
jgi:hypothetical protein